MLARFRRSAPQGRERFRQNHAKSIAPLRGSADRLLEGGEAGRVAFAKPAAAPWTDPPNRSR